MPTNLNIEEVNIVYGGFCIHFPSLEYDELGAMCPCENL